MGSEDSKLNQSNKNISELQLNASFNSSNYDDNIISSKSEETFSKIKSDKKNIEKKDKNKYPIIFEWTGGGNSVYLSGSFCNWNQLFLMQKNSEGKYILQLDVNKAIIQYKFKVDNEWKINQNFPSILDHGNLNNYIDLNKLDIISRDKSEATTDENTDSSNKNLEKEFNIKNYGNYFLKYKDLSEAKIVPDNFKIIKNKENNDINFMENEKINHLIVKNKNSNVVSIVCRYRLKHTNFIFYKNG